MSALDTVSVIVPTYKNDPLHLAAAVSSALSQTYPKLEVIIVNDDPENEIGRGDEVWLSDPRIRIIQNLENVGSAKSRNIGVKNANGRFIAFLDSDDLWHPKKIFEQIKFMESNRLGACCTSYIATNEANKIAFSVRAFRKISNTLLWSTTNVACSSVLIDVKYLKSLPLMPAYRHSHDTALWSSLISQVKFGGLEKPLLNYRVGHASATSKRFKTLAYNLQVFLAELGLLRGLAFFCCYVIVASLKRFGIFRVPSDQIREHWPKETNDLLTFLRNPIK